MLEQFQFWFGLTGWVLAAVFAWLWLNELFNYQDRMKDTKQED